ncbi:hypothetical protein G7Y89_g3744 [Cudoniella acicularis]|uniref:Protein kinase domain-containing protein n=1 Tax=Cudoniella acicularis TaxID=354080 RepID=A0A8H4RRM3_9HELO|nr:hypothetical protein G7Y89_g3744 [Cudoniella acicularis]
MMISLDVPVTDCPIAKQWFQNTKRSRAKALGLTTHITEVRPSSGLVPWDPAVQLNVPGSGPDLLDPPKAQGSAASHSSVVNDLGNARYLTEDRTSTYATSNRDSRALTEELVVHLGAGLTIDTVGDQVLREVDLTSQGDATSQENLDGSFLEHEVAQRETLGEFIRAALEVSQTGEKGKFLPNDALERIVTRERVLNELSKYKLGSPAQLENFANEIWKVTKIRGKETTRRKIFAILGLIEECGDIVNFIRNGLYDIDLPFVLAPHKAHPGRPQLWRKGMNGKLEPIQFLIKWRTPVHESFHHNQWQLIAPYFRLLTESDGKVLHYPLDDHIILPFIEDDEVKQNPRPAEGGYGDVWRVKIHPAHHNCCKDTARPHENPSYAVKRLRHSDQQAFNAEVSNLKRFSAKDHVHLIKLLVTFSWRDRFYLLFPWADGNLLAFWTNLFPEPSIPKRDQNHAVWFSKQCLGIAQGLQMIHTSDLPSSDDLHNDASSLQIHGRHGDLKPENILWFKPYEGTDPSDFGVLKISDFGLTRFHGTRSKSHFESVAVSPTYRPPEHEVAMMVSQSFDIWSLGCVLLEFVTWCLLGGAGVDEFSKERAKDDSREFRQDVFYNFVQIKENNGDTQLGARAKRSVANEFQTLYSQESCSDFTLDLLTFIKDRLLRVGPQNRATCKEIVEKFEELHKECKSDLDYCTKRMKKIPERSETGLSELSASTVRLSKARTDQINRNSLPEHTGPLEENVSSSQPPKSPPLGAKSDTLNRYGPNMRSLSPERMEPELKGKATERMNTVPEEKTSSLTAFFGPHLCKENENAPLDVENTGKQSSRPQSPNRNVHFEKKPSQKWEIPGSELGNHFGTFGDRHFDYEDHNEDQREAPFMEYHAIPSNTSGPSITGLALPGLPASALPAPAQQNNLEHPVNSVNGFRWTPASNQPDPPDHTDHAGTDEALIGDNVIENGGLPLDNSKLSGIQANERLEVDTDDAHNPSTNTETGGGEYPSGTINETLEPFQPQRQTNSVNVGMNGTVVHGKDEVSGDKATRKSMSKVNEFEESRGKWTSPPSMPSRQLQQLLEEEEEKGIQEMPEMHVKVVDRNVFAIISTSSYLPC